jgi:hypothetical protein
MASWREIDRISKSPAEARRIAAGLLKFHSLDLSEWEAAYLESIARHPEDEQLTTRQSEKLLQIRDDIQLISEYRGFSVAILVEKVHLARLDLSQDDEDWIVGIRQRSGGMISRKNAGRLLRLAHQLNLIEDEVA